MPQESVNLVVSTEEVLSIDVSELVTVDNIASAKQQRLLNEPLYSSWVTERTFLACSNVGLFYALRHPPLVPDFFLSLDVGVPENWCEKKNRSYFFWEFGKPPEIVLEIVSNKIGHELDTKLTAYARMRVNYYVVFEPSHQISDPVVQVFELHHNRYIPRTDFWLAEIGLGLTLWHGVFEQKEQTWLRWCDASGQVIPTGAERADQERQKAAQYLATVERLAQRLRDLDLDPGL